VVQGDNIREWSVYIHIFPNGKKYDGISQQPEKRWNKGHGYDNQPKMARAVKKYGWNNIKHKIVAIGLKKSEAEAVERALIQALDSIENGYNVSIGGESINACYLDEYVMYMIRESDRLDNEYGIEPPHDSIVTIAKRAKYDFNLAEIFNGANKILNDNYTGYKRYQNKSPLVDIGSRRVDEYWWYIAQIVAGNIEKPSADGHEYQKAWHEYFLGGAI
jgi:predicted GIY-YIG superfamily endonuclease